VTDANFQAEVLNVRGKPVLVDCWAEWCGPCRAISPIVEQIAAGAGGRWKVGKLNVDFNNGIAGQYRIEGIPTLLIFKDGKLVDRIVGLQPKSAIEARLAASTEL
jgi:thioredoxin